MNHFANALFLTSLAASTLFAQVPARQWTLTREIQVGSTTDTLATLVAPQIAMIAPMGEILVFDYGTRQIKAYDASGKFMRAIGRQGQGPGEFNRVLTMGFLGDTLWTNDSPQYRITLFPPNSQNYKTFDIFYETGQAAGPGSRGTNIVVRSSPKALLRGGLAVAQGSFSAGALGYPPTPLAAPIVLMRRDGSIVDTVAVPVCRVSRNVTTRVGSATLTASQPFQAEQYWGARPDGKGFFVVDNPEVGNRAQAAFTVQAFDSAGRSIAITRYPYEPTSVTPRLRDSVINAMKELRRGRGATPVQLDSISMQLAVPPYLPTITAMRVGRDGSVWLRRESLQNEGLKWSVINAAGEMVAAVNMPPSATVLYADLQHVLTMETDANGERWVVRYRVNRASQ